MGKLISIQKKLIFLYEIDFICLPTTKLLHLSKLKKKLLFKYMYFLYLGLDDKCHLKKTTDGARLRSLCLIIQTRI